MNNFIFITHLDVLPVMPRLAKLKPETWPGRPERGETGNPLIGLGASLFLREHDNVTEENWLDDLPVKDCGELPEWPTMRRLLAQARRAIMATPLGQEYLSGQAGRAMLSRLDARPPVGNEIFRHIDDGPYHQRNVRFHIPLTTNPGCFSESGLDRVHMEVGSLWYFNNRVTHKSANLGHTHRVHVIFEMRKKDGVP